MFSPHTFMPSGSFFTSSAFMGKCFLEIWFVTSSVAITEYFDNINPSFIT